MQSLHHASPLPVCRHNSCPCACITPAPCIIRAFAPSTTLASCAFTSPRDLAHPCPCAMHRPGPCIALHHASPLPLSHVSPLPLRHASPLPCRGDKALVHWWYLPDSYDERVPRESTNHRLEPNRMPVGAWKVRGHCDAEGEGALGRRR